MGNPERSHPDRPAVSALPGGDKPTLRGGVGAGGMAEALAVLRARIDEEFRLAERFDAKSRQAFALALGAFGLTQTVAFGSFAQHGVTSAERAVLGISAALGALALIVLGHRLSNAEEPVQVRDVQPEAIVKWCEGADSGTPLELNLVRALASTARDRTDSNCAGRKARYDAVAIAARWTLILSAVELALGIIFRL